mmetsp:Transcript_95869/g.240275  ORF Transcript_95869/g.240275 Transcript_95869/m.240275 type:complete len:256 (-) Transcript_95869:64-831(-)
MSRSGLHRQQPTLGGVDHRAGDHVLRHRRHVGLGPLLAPAIPPSATQGGRHHGRWNYGGSWHRRQPPRRQDHTGPRAQRPQRRLPRLGSLRGARRPCGRGRAQRQRARQNSLDLRDALGPADLHVRFYGPDGRNLYVRHPSGAARTIQRHSNPPNPYLGRCHQPAHHRRRLGPNWLADLRDAAYLGQRGDHRCLLAGWLLGAASARAGATARGQGREAGLDEIRALRPGSCCRLQRRGFYVAGRGRGRHGYQRVG